MDNKPTASLGCGSLILIALIVLIFSGRGRDRDLQRDVRRLDDRVEQLQRETRALTEEVRKLRLQLEPPAVQKRPGAPPADEKK